MRASSNGRRLPLVKLPISSQGKESRRWGWRKSCGGGGSSKMGKKNNNEVKKEIRKKMKMRITKK